MEKGSISLCMIIKDEEKLIRQCLQSVCHIVDEIIIVDTGSTDKSLEICNEFNTKIYHYEWNDHFADARNFSISKATSDWILCLDADEQLETIKLESLTDIILKTNVHQILLPILMYYGDNIPIQPENFYTYYQPRIFRNHIGFKYKNRIHETLTLPDVSEKITEERITIPINHFGYIREIEVEKEKSKRNLKLLKMEYNISNNNPWIAYHLGSEYYRLQDYPQAFDYINESIYDFLLLNLKPPALLYRLKYAILIETNSIEGAWPGIDKAVQLYPDYVDLLFYKGYILYKKQDFHNAIKTFKECLTLNENHPDYLILKGTGSFMAEEFIEKCQVKISSTEQDKQKRILYIGWIGFQNLGDELMYDLFKEKVSEMEGDFHIDVVNYVEKYLQNVNISDFDLIVLGGGSIFSGPRHTIEPYLIQFLYDAIKVEKKVMIWGSGIDSLSETAISTVGNGGKIDLNLSDKMIKKINYVFENSVWSGVRGPLTLNVFKGLGTANNLQQSGDPGFLMQMKQSNTIREKENIIGVNWGTTYNSLYGGDEMKVENQLVDTLKELIRQGYKIYLFVLWGPDTEASLRLYEKLSNPKMVTFDAKLYDYHGLLPIINKFKFTINFKLHASYLSLAAGTPFIALGYRFKVYDFVKSIQMENFIISTNTSELEQKTLALTEYITENEQSIITHMKTIQDKYVEKLLVPFQNNLYL